MVCENTNSFFRRKKNVGGSVAMPPTTGLRSAYTAAYVAAYAEPTENADGAFFRPVRIKGQLTKIGRKSPEWKC